MTRADARQTTTDPDPSSRIIAMITTHPPRPAGAGAKAPPAPPVRRSVEAAALDPSVWQRILQSVRTQHPSLHRVWFDQMTPRQLTNGVIQVTVATAAQLNFCQ